MPERSDKTDLGAFLVLWGRLLFRMELWEDVRMRMWRHWLVVLGLPWVMAGWAAAQVGQGEEDTPVDRVIKAAQEIRLDEQRPLELQPRPKSNDSGVYFGGQLANLTGDARPEA